MLSDKWSDLRPRQCEAIYIYTFGGLWGGHVNEDVIASHGLSVTTHYSRLFFLGCWGSGLPIQLNPVIEHKLGD